MQNENKKRSFFTRLVYFFPLQLLFVHLKKNHQLLLFWLLLFLIIYQEIGNKYGLPLLFLAPEYLGKLSFSSYFILGFALGGFVMAFNISSYIMNGFRFPFLATLSKPFFKYCTNNSMLPSLFILAYSFEAYQFLSINEDFSTNQILYRLLGFLGGYFIFIFFSMFYFMATNKDLEKLFGKEIAKVVSSDTKKGEPAKILLNKPEKSWYKRQEADSKSWRVDSYIGMMFKLKMTRPYGHYDQKMLSQVFRQNHINASLFELVIIISIIILGLFREYEVFIIPAAATITLLCTMLLMITSAMRSWLRGWTWVVILIILIGLNQLSKFDTFYYESRAYGLNYEHQSTYLSENNTFQKEIREDVRLNEGVLQKWKAKNQKGALTKPKALFVASSGGGSRAALWSFLALQHLDSISKGELFNHSIMYTGSSGGVIGTSYFRELKWRQQKDSLNAYHKKFSLDLSKDMLNPVFFTLAVNDILIRTQRFSYQGNKYWKDRGYIFEKTLNQHSRGFMDKPLSEYHEAEVRAEIPSLIVTPSIVNDSRRLLVSTLPMSFMTTAGGPDNDFLKENVEFIELFKHNDPLNTRFLSILRMNSSFPYIMPTVNLPSDPAIEVFDSGLRDNYGIKTTVKYIFHLRKWLEENTSGVIILQIRDGLKSSRKEIKKGKRSIADQLLSPFGSLYGNWFQVQDFNNDELIEYASSWYSGEFEVINYQLDKSPQKNISLSWHLTSKEKQQILSSLELEQNKEAAQRLINLLN